MVELDKVDRLILNTLQNNGRMTNVELAEVAGISAPPCLRRLKLMSQRGIIQGYHAKINPNIMGYGLKVLCIITLNSQYINKIAEFIETVTKLKNIRSCFSTPGSESFVLEILARNLSDYEEILKAKIQKHEEIAEVKSYILLNTHKELPGIPIDI
ncbi:MAG: Lrp/AsnC family transcriptional regulator [Alphaproteobacteria bacterium]|nr:Lrp/AsnC family transcriptional regulator [Alphaproteobacteria bacterium]